MNKKSIMQSKIITLLLILVLGISCFTLVPMKVEAAGNTHIVQPGDDLQSIIDSANEGDIINIAALATPSTMYKFGGSLPSGPYNTYTIDKELTIVGQGSYEWHKGYWQSQSCLILLNITFKLENDAALTIQDGFFIKIADAMTGPSTAIVSGKGNLIVKDSIIDCASVSTAAYATAEPTIDVDGNVTIEGNNIDSISGYDKYHSTKVYGASTHNVDSSIQSGYAGTAVKATKTVTVHGGWIEGGNTAHPKVRGGHGIEAKDVIIESESVTHATQSSIYDNVWVHGGGAPNDTGLMAGHGIVASGDVTVKGGLVRGGQANFMEENKENPLVMGGSGIVAGGNVTLEGKFVEHMGKTLYSTRVTGGKGIYQSGVPVVMNGSRANGPKIFTMKTAQIWSESFMDPSSKYDAPYSVQMDNKDIAIVEDSYLGWWYNIPMFSGGQLSMKNMRSVYSTLENVTSYEVNQMLKSTKDFVPSHYTTASWDAYQNVLDKIGTSFYHAGDEDSSQTLLAAVDRMNDLITELDGAIKGLKLAADYTKVNQAIAKIPVNLSIYTDKSVQVLLDAKDAVVYGKDITEQAIVDGYATAIEDAIKALVKKSATENTIKDLNEKPTIPTSSTISASSKKSDSFTNTGDNTIMMLYLILGFSSTIALLGISRKIKNTNS